MSFSVDILEILEMWVDGWDCCPPFRNRAFTSVKIINKWKSSWYKK